MLFTKQMILLIMLLFSPLRTTGEGVSPNQNENGTNQKRNFLKYAKTNSLKDTTIYQLALKTNLLFDLVGAPNLGVEIPFGKDKNFSVAADAAYAYWQINNLYALQTIQGGIETKYWFNTLCGPLIGWNAGVYGMYCTRYDVQWKDGYQGDGFWSAGLSAGYSALISKRLNLEFAVAGGYFYTPEVRHYNRPEKGHLLWEETRTDVVRFSLTKVKINIVWLIAKKKRFK